MKLKTLVKLNALKQSPARIEINYTDETGHKRLIDISSLDDYLRFKDFKIVDWNYYQSEEQDFISVYLAGAC
jgi:hypothetical protein